MSNLQSSSHLVWPPFIAAQTVSLPLVLAGLKRSQNWPAAKFAWGQRAQLRVLLEWAANNVPYYRGAVWLAPALAGMQHSPDNFWDIWRTLPVLTKADLRAHGAQLNAPEIPRFQLPLDKTVTSGSTGISVEVKTTAVTRLIWNAMTVREHVWQGRDPALRHGAIRYFAQNLRHPRGVVIPDWGPPIAQCFRTGPAGLMHVGYPMDMLAAWLRRFDPQYLLTYPSVAAALLDECGAPSAKPPSLRNISLISEPLTPGLEARLKTEWNVSVSEFYSANEMGCIAFRCAEQNRLHVQSEALLLEIIDDSSNPCAIGETGRVVITPLHNLATPLIRYELGDYAILGEPCACGRTMPVIEKVLGRVRNLVRTPAGRRYWPVELGKFKAMASVRQAQYVQTALDTIQLRLVLNNPLTSAEQQRVVELTQSALGYPFRVEIAPVTEIARGPTGKFEEFLSLLPAE